MRRPITSDSLSAVIQQNASHNNIRKILQNKDHRRERAPRMCVGPLFVGPLLYWEHFRSFRCIASLAGKAPFLMITCTVYSTDSVTNWLAFAGMETLSRS